MSEAGRPEDKPVDMVNHPPHYHAHPSGIEVITIAEHFDFLAGNALKYLFRAGHKEGTTRLEDLLKCQYYVNRAVEKERRESEQETK